MERVRIISCSAVRAERFLATSSTPEVSRSRRWASSRKRASGRIARSDSITPCATPLPPCTARPAGLSMATSASSSRRMGSLKCGAGTGSPRAATRTGGTRMRSPAAIRSEAATRLLLIRTSPPRRMR